MNKKYSAIAAGVMMAVAGTAAEASHFRGAAMLPSVNANGLLTVTTTSFWRNGAASGVFSNVGGGAAFVSQSPQVNDTSDSRFTKSINVNTYQLPSAGTYAITGSSCCRVQGIQNFLPGGSSVSWTMNSTIVWNGSSANAPILFNFSAVQPEVVRGVAYNGNLGAVGGAGITLSYDQTLNGIPNQPPGFTVNTSTGALNIPAVNTAAYTDNTAGNPGADYAFSGNINASDGSKVEFDWLFDAVNTAGNTAPTVTDAIINALVGATINHTFTATDDGLPNPPNALTWTGLISFLGAAPAILPTFDPLTRLFTWNSTGSAPGSYNALVQVSDGSLTDIGQLTINLRSQPNGVPEPATLSLLGLGLAGLGWMGRKKKPANG